MKNNWMRKAQTDRAVDARRAGGRSGKRTHAVSPKNPAQKSSQIKTTQKQHAPTPAAANTR
jgi:hypothetical protein